MKNKPSWLIAVIIILALGYSVYHFRHAPRPKNVTSTAIFNARLPDLAGISQPLEQWRGKVLVVNFWATWCPPCRHEIPGFIELQKRYGPQGLQFVGIAIDGKPKVQAFANQVGLNYPVLVSELEGVALERASGDYSSEIPYTVIIDRSGKVIAAGAGEMGQREIINLATPLLQKQ